MHTHTHATVSLEKTFILIKASTYFEYQKMKQIEIG